MTYYRRLGLAAVVSLSSFSAHADSQGDHVEELNPVCADAGISQYFCEWALDGGGNLREPDIIRDLAIFSENCAQYGEREAECAVQMAIILQAADAYEHDHD